MLPVWIAFVLLPVLGGAERFNCRGRILGAYYADAKSGCKAFHVCVRVAGGGIRDFRFFCPPGTLFHQEAQTCTDWGDDDPLACPAEIYDGQFDLYKIGSGFDTKKSSPANREEESEFGLQRAETGDRRLSQNNAASDLRAAHSSDFFSGQRDRGRDDPAPAQTHQRTNQQQPQHHHASHNQPQQQPPNQPSSQQPSHAPRQSFRRPTTPRAPPSSTQYTNPPPPPQSSNVPQYDNSKRKLVRKRPIYVSQSTPAPQTTFAQSTQPPQSFPEQAPQQQIFNRRVPHNRQSIPPVSVPPQYKDYKDEYVEVSRVTPKPNKYFQSKVPTPFSQSTPAPKYNKNDKDGLVEIYNYDTQSTPGLGSQNDNRPFKIQNSFSVSEPQRNPDFARSNNINQNRGSPTTVDYTIPSRATTPAFKNYNSVSYEPEKNNFVSYSKQQNYFSNPTTTPTTTYYTTTFRPDPPQNLNTVAYNTNIGFGNTQSNYAESDEDDGQYRPPQGEDDGQYRPELYERELLSGAHSLNIAASGNRLPEDQKPKGKTQAPFKTSSQSSQTPANVVSQTPLKSASQTPYKPVVSQTAAPRPFRPAPTPSSAATQRASENYPTSIRPQTQPQSQRTFDYFQTYTTTSRPKEAPANPAAFSSNDNNLPAKQTTTSASRNQEPRQQSRAPTPPVLRPTTRSPFFASPANNKEDNSYDYAYYDSDPGFSEYDHIEEFGKTKTKKA